VVPNAADTQRTTVSKSKPKSNLRTVSDKTVVHHKVKKGETLTSIASTHHTTVAALKRDNGDIAALRPGMVLLVRPAK
jgi:LysM repeat protein